MMTASRIVHERFQLISCWCGLGFFVLFFFGLLPMMGFFPPPSPMMSGEELLAKYTENILLIKVGIIVCIIGSSLLIPWSVMIAFQVSRMEAGRLPFMTVLSLSAGMINALLFILPFIFWSGAFYRADRDPELIRLLNDVTWLEFVMIVPPYALQMFAIAYAGLTSTAKREVIPRWFCYFNIWVALLTFPGMLAIIFFEGPFAWNGILAFYLPVSVFILYFPCSFWVFYRAVKTHKLDVENSNPSGVENTLRTVLS
ncbi:hypothetical protein HBA55_04505 [Pseudomaricurvus alkylphenolicus]|uniref:hypothetical protein n=1 Tax=Pseudomaricurvus alkylphenolicus TaxID=1306991 RepID=UPI001422F779|nr:hypothetical protein [Pseudomaricurvus alkylphenolicus]NIB38833.1 hypothetical protein [Pseudomaricurvus alkylphenolicus]